MAGLAMLAVCVWAFLARFALPKQNSGVIMKNLLDTPASGKSEHSNSDHSEDCNLKQVPGASGQVVKYTLWSKPVTVCKSAIAVLVSVIIIAVVVWVLDKCGWVLSNFFSGDYWQAFFRDAAAPLSMTGAGLVAVAGWYLWRAPSPKRKQAIEKAAQENEALWVDYQAMGGFLAMCGGVLVAISALFTLALAPQPANDFVTQEQLNTVMQNHLSAP